MTVRILIGDCRERLKDLADNSVDSVVCDPPYHLTSIVKRFGSPTAAPIKVKKIPGQSGSPHARAAKGFMGQTWDGGDVAFQPETWAEVLRVLKPGGHLIAFSGTRTYHRMAVAIEDAGFEVRDMVSWIYGSGFPKSHNIDKALGDGHRCLCEVERPQAERDLRFVPSSDVSSAPSAESSGGQVLFAPVPQQSLSGAEGTEPAQGIADGAQPSVEGRCDAEAGARQLSGREVSASAGMGATDGASGRLHNAAPASDGADVRLPADANGSGEPQGSQSGEQPSIESGTVADERGSQTRGSRALCGGCGKPIVEQGLGTALKPSVEPICLARKPLSEKSIAANVLKWGTGALNIDGCRIEGEKRSPEFKNPTSKGIWSGAEQQTEWDASLGRWPANLCHDGSDEVVAGFPETADSPSGPVKQGKRRDGSGWDRDCNDTHEGFGTGFGDSGSAARFFYCAKTSSEERGDGNNHPTVKPVALMRWLVRLVTPKGGTVLDPFMGSGSTALACDAEQFDFIGSELSAEYAAIAESRVRAAAGLFAEVRAA